MEQAVISKITLFIAIMSIIGFIQMGIDKHRAVKKAWRIPERNLFLIAALGGGIGSFLGMYVFHHKTKHMKFKVLFPILAGLYAFLILKLNSII